MRAIIVMTVLVVVLALLAGCGDTARQAVGSSVETTETHWFLSWVDAITFETVMRAGAAACALLGVLCAIGAIGCVVFGRPKLAAMCGAAAPMLIVAGPMLAWLGLNAWWIAILCALPAAIAGGVWVWRSGIPAFERATGKDFVFNGPLDGGQST